MLNELLKVGIVVQTNPSKGTARVRITDADDEITYELPVIVRASFRDKAYWMPDIGECVVCIFSGEGLEQGFILGAIYNAQDKTPTDEQAERMVKFKDGTVIEYDRDSHRLYIHSVGDIEIVSDTHITLVAPRIDLNP